MQAGKRKQKLASAQTTAAAGRRAAGPKDADHSSRLSSVLTPSLRLQPKLRIGKPGDRYEQEADRIAGQVVNQPPLRTPTLIPPPGTNVQPRRPPGITPVIQQQSDVPDTDENLSVEADQTVQGYDLHYQADSATASIGENKPVQRKTEAGIPRSGPSRTSKAARRSYPMRPTGRAPPNLSLIKGGMTARAPPVQLKSTAVQTDSSLAFSAPEQQADDIQEHPNFMTDQEGGEVRPKFLQCRGPPIQARTGGTEDRLDHELRQSRGGGAPLPEKTRIQMEAAIGADFKNVRIHKGSDAGRMNKMLDSRAFAYGNDVVFGAGQYDPESREGQYLLAHELTHTVQQGASPHKTVNPAVSPRAPPIQRSAPLLQGGFIGDRLNEYARHVPGWELFTVIIEYNPLTEQDVPRTPQNLLRGFMGLIPGGTALYDKLNQNGLIDDAFSWLTAQLSDLNLSWSRLRNAIDAAWEEMDFIRWDPFDYNLRVLKRHLLPIWNDVKEFADRVIDKTVELVRTTMLTPLVNFIKDRTRAYPLLTVILGEDPVTGEAVERSLYNIVSAFLMLTESGEEYLNKLNESGKLQELSDWLDAEIERLDVSVETVTNAFSEAWELLDLNAVLHPIDTFTRLYNIFAGPVTRLFNFVVAVAMKVLGLIKDWLLGLLKEHAHRIPGYPLLTVILEEDPLTGEEVPRTAENFIRGFMSFVPGGMEKFNNLKESGAIDKAFAWLQKAIKKLGLIGAAFANAFTQMWDSFSINDLTNPIGAFERIVAIFTQPVRMLIEFAIEVGLKVLEFIFIGVLGERGARVLEILKKARSTFMTIIKDPIGFLGNLLNALKKGFMQFSGNILTHLKNGLVGWLLGALEGAGLELPEQFDFKGIFSLVMQVLGLTWPQLRPKFVKHLGDRVVSAAETAFDWIMLIRERGFAGVWERILEKINEWIDGLKQKVMEGIRNWVVTKIIQSAITKLATMFNPVGAVIQSIITMYNTVQFFLERFDQILTLVETIVESISKIASGAIADAANWVEQAMARTIPVIISFLARLIGLGGISTTIKNLITKIQDWVGEKVDRLIGWIVAKVKQLFRPRNREAQTDEQRAENKRKAIEEINGRLSSGINYGEVDAFLAGIKEKYQLESVTMGAGFDIQVKNSAEITIAAEAELPEQDVNQIMGRTAEGQLTSDPAQAEFEVGEFNSRVDNPKTVYGVLIDGLAASGTGIQAEDLEYNNFISRMEVSPARPLLVSSKIYGYSQSFFADARRSGISANVAKIGNIERSYRDRRFREQQTGYNGGHLVGHAFGGPASYENLAPMKGSLNTGLYAKFENFMRSNVEVENAAQLDRTKSFMEFDIMPNYEGTFSFTGEQLLGTLERGLVTEIQNAEQSLELYRNKEQFLTEYLGQTPEKQAEIRQFVADNKDEARELSAKLPDYLALYHLLNQNRAQSTANSLRSGTVTMASRAIALLNIIIPEAGEFESDYESYRSQLQTVVSAEAADGAAVSAGTMTADQKRTNVQVRKQTVIDDIQPPFYEKVINDKALNASTRARIRNLRGITSIPSTIEAINTKIQGYRTTIEGLQEVVNEASGTNRRGNIAPLSNSPFKDATFEVHGRIPTSFTVNLEYAAKYGEGDSPTAASEQSRASGMEAAPGRPGVISDVNVTAGTRIVKEQGDGGGQAPAQQAQGGAPARGQDAGASGGQGSGTAPATDRTFNLTFDIAQAKLQRTTTAAENDAYEQQADRVADQVVAGQENTTPITRVQRKSSIQRSGDDEANASTGFENSLQASNSGGDSLTDDTRAEMASGIGADFSNVKIHTDSNAVQMSKAMGAKAFTYQNHVYFNQGQYSPTTTDGKHLLAHELTHVVQQDDKVRRVPDSVTPLPVTDEKNVDTGPPKLGGATMPGLEPPVEGEIQSPAQVEARAEADAGIKKDKKVPGAGKKGKAQGAKEKQKPAGGRKEKKAVQKKVADEKSAGEQPPAPAPKPLKNGSSDGMLNDFMTSPASRIAASYPTLGAGVSEIFKAEKKQETDSAPNLVARAGKGPMAARPPPGEEKSAQEAAIEEKQPQPSPLQKVAEHKNLAKPLNNARNNKALDQSPAGSWISWFKERVFSFMSSIRTKDQGVNTRAGKPPKAKLTGEADPKRADTQRKDGDQQAGNAKESVSAKIKANPGKQRIQPAPVEQTSEVKIEAAAAQLETGKQDDMADYVQMPLPDNVRKKADQDMAPLLEKSLSKPKEDVNKAANKRNADKQAEMSKAKAEVNKLNSKADQDQKHIVDTSRNDVATEQKKGFDEAYRSLKKYRKDADKEQKSLRDKVKKRVKEDEGKAAAKLKKAEQDAEKEKKKKEAEAAAKKKELKKKQKKKSWWSRVKSAIKSVVKAITKAIDGIFKALRKAVKFIIETAKKAALAIIELGRKFVVGLLNTFRKFLKSLVTNLIGKVFPELAKKINKAIDKVVDKAIAGVNKVADALKKGVEALANALGKMLDKILSVFQTALKAAVQIAGAVLTGDFAEAAKIAFYAACDILGINPKSVIDFMEKAGESLGKIFKSPSTFFNNVARGVKKGIDQFVAKIKQHLLNGLIAWLTGAMGDIQITLPEKFDIKGIFSLVTQILGLTYANIRAKVVKKLGPKGEKIVSTLEKTFALVKDLVTKGPIALWERVKQSLSNLKDRVIEGIRNAVIEKVVKAGVVWLISMLNPASALVKATKMLYDLVMFFVERWDQIVAFAASIWNSVNALANGRIGAAAYAVEQALARSIPVVLSLLASLLGLGGIGKSVQKVIRKIRKPIDKVVDKVIDFIFKTGKKLLAKLSGKAGAKKPHEKQTPQEREKNKLACEKEIRAIMSKGTTFGRFKAMIPKLKKKHGVKEIRMDADFDVKVINSAPSEIKVAVAHEIGLDKEGKLVEAKPVSKGKKGEPKYDKPKPKEEFTFGTINLSSDHPATLKAVLDKELKKHRLTLEEIEFNQYFSGFPASAARPSKVSGTIYGYIAGKVGAKARTGTSAIVGKMGNREASFREGSFRGGEGGYDGGHLISHSFGGPDAYYNLVPMKARVNRQVYGGIEKFMRNQVRVEQTALPLDKKKSNLDISVAMNYGVGSYNINMGQFLKVATGGLKSEKDKLRKQKEENLAKKLKLEEIKKGLPKDPKKAAAELKRYSREREAKKSELKKRRETEERDLLVWNLARGSGLLGSAGLLHDKKQARAQVSQAEKILDPLAKLITSLKGADPGAILISSLVLRQRVITRLIAEFGDAYSADPLHKDDRRLSWQGFLLRKHIIGLQKPRDLTRSLEKELARMPTIPESEKEIDAKIKEYDEKVQHAIKELARTDQTGKLATLKDKKFSDAGSVPVHSRIPTSFTVDLDYEAIAGKSGQAMVKADAKGTRKEFSKADFRPPEGASTASYGTITISNARPDTKLIIEDKAPRQDRTKPAGRPQEEVDGKPGAGGKVITEQRFKTTFTITQA